MQFTPLKFQLPLAAGGIALMAFNFLEFAIPHGESMVKMSDVISAGLTTQQINLYLPLIIIMLVFSTISIGLTIGYLKQLIQWLTTNRAEYLKFMSGPPTLSVGIFVPIANISMAALVFLAPGQFFVPQLSSNLQAMMLPGIIFFGILCLTIFYLEFKVLKTWLSRPIDLKKLNFVWLLDVFSFGLLSLIGTGLAVMAESVQIASIGAIGSSFTLTFGIFLLIVKLSYLFHLHMKADGLPGENVLPAFFILVPISCLYGFSFYRVALYLQTRLLFNMEVFLFGILVISYIISVIWALFCVYLLSEYLLKVFRRVDFAFPQWSMV
ncbi:MAG: hypothetical protein K9K64_06965 [Desulfohalobiaceae bacterium]|nr:hypothetical protein [Desulfohalobiaceae bacterium]